MHGLVSKVKHMKGKESPFPKFHRFLGTCLPSLSRKKYPGIPILTLPQDKEWLYLEDCEDGSREGIKIRGWSFILEIEPGEKGEIKIRVGRDRKLQAALEHPLTPHKPSQGATFVPPGCNTPGKLAGEHLRRCLTEPSAKTQFHSQRKCWCFEIHFHPQLKWTIKNLQSFCRMSHST